MNPAFAERRRSVPLVALAVAALLASLLTVAASRQDANASEHDGHGHGSAVALRNNAQVTFHDQMRKLWEDHVTWTRLAIVTFADGSSGFDSSATRLLQNQTDIGNAIKPFYGDAAGKKLTALLDDHITIAVELLQAAKAGDTGAFNAANTRWYANANAIADFLSAANPKSWPRAVMRAGMKEHLDQTLAEASDELHGSYTASVTDYEAIHLHMLDMADMLSSGIIHQFPSRFR